MDLDAIPTRSDPSARTQSAPPPTVRLDPMETDLAGANRRRHERLPAGVCGRTTEGHEGGLL